MAGTCEGGGHAPGEVSNAHEEGSEEVLLIYQDCLLYNFKIVYSIRLFIVS